jgi:hypothetical protein
VLGLLLLLFDAIPIVTQTQPLDANPPQPGHNFRLELLTAVEGVDFKSWTGRFSESLRINWAQQVRTAEIGGVTCSPSTKEPCRFLFASAESVRTAD